MNKIRWIILLFFIAVITTLGILNFKRNAELSNHNPLNTPSQSHASEPTVLPKSFVVEKLPVFAAQDCENKGGRVQEFTERGTTVEKCIFEDQ